MKGILFLCVANSARSQIAEGLARHMARPGINVWSAGSRPTAVRPEAVQVLHECGIDITGQWSKSIADVPADQVDFVVTLCGEQECPFFAGRMTRLEWEMPDPAAVDGPADARLDAFRRTRDELLERIRELLVRENAAGEGALQ